MTQDWEKMEMIRQVGDVSILGFLWNLLGGIEIYEKVIFLILGREAFILVRAGGETRIWWDLVARQEFDAIWLRSIELCEFWSRGVESIVFGGIGKRNKEIKEIKKQRNKHACMHKALERTTAWGKGRQNDCCFLKNYETKKSMKIDRNHGSSASWKVF